MNGNILLDTNVIIYLSKKTLLPEQIFNEGNINSISVISKMELLGYPFKNHLEEQYLLEILNALVIVPLTDEIVNLTIEIRKKYKIKLPDAIIYATAKALNAKLITNNITDFSKTDETVELINPFT